MKSSYLFVKERKNEKHNYIIISIDYFVICYNLRMYKFQIQNNYKNINFVSYWLGILEIFLTIDNYTLNENFLEFRFSNTHVVDENENKPIYMYTLHVWPITFRKLFAEILSPLSHSYRSPFPTQLVLANEKPCPF